MTLFEKYAAEIKTFVDVCHRLSKNMYVTGFGGNAAWKMEDGVLLITPTQMNKGEIQHDDVVFINLRGEVLEGKRRPTGETPMYVNFFTQRPDIQSVIHCHPPYTNAFTISEGKNWLMRPLFPETITEVGPVPLVPFAQPLTQELADRFLPFLQEYNAFLMENHGLVILSRLDIKWTMMNTELLEMTSLHIHNAAIHGDIKEISRDEIRKMDEIMKTRNLPLMGAPGVHTSLVDVFYGEE
ncbi:MAG: class II aldolase/adducin family protein [Candidatus Hydrogenedentes bacterium]|nr:class II aldolase/adducin family protein [Candidatus Hydrogenedentota bacterium]